MERLSSGAAAVLLGVSPNWVLSLARTGRLRHSRYRGHLSFALSDVVALRVERARRPAVRRGRPTVVEQLRREGAIE